MNVVALHRLDLGEIPVAKIIKDLQKATHDGIHQKLPRRIPNMEY